MSLHRKPLFSVHENHRFSLYLKRNPQQRKTQRVFACRKLQFPAGKETVKGITSAMLVFLGAVVVAIIVLMVVIAFANEESGSGGLAMTIGKGICGFLATSIGGFGSAICNI